MKNLSELALRFRSSYAEYDGNISSVVHVVLMFFVDWWLWILLVIRGVLLAPDSGGWPFLWAFILIILLHVIAELMIRAMVSSGTSARTELARRHSAKVRKMKGKIKAKCDSCRKTFDPSISMEITSKEDFDHNVEVLRHNGEGLFCSYECDEIFAEMQKMKDSEERARIRSKAEKRLYGKVKAKKKRVPLSKELRERVYRKHKHQCMICSQKQGLHIHHKDHDPKNNAMRNLLLLCGVCHKKIHMKVR